MDPKSSSSYGIKTQLSLASLMFFGPFIKHFLTENEDFALDESEKSFVKGYMVLGSINLGLAVICTAIGILSKFINVQAVDILFLVFSSVLLFLLLAGSIAVFADISINTTQNTNLTESISKELSANSNAIRDYLPFVNIYLWYSTHDFDGKHPIIKESLLIWTIFGLLCFTGNLWIIGVMLVAIILRIVTLTVIGDLLPQQWHDTIAKMFRKNIEETWGWVLGGFKQCPKQTDYGYLYDFKRYGNIQRQYLVLLLMTGYLLFVTRGLEGFALIVVGTMFIWGRYAMMAILWGHIPPLPLIHDIFRTLGSLFDKKIQTNNK